ncbi:MAG: hypothetical protein QXY29_03370, partial [Candidatus Aenigmatarchaeota archaeon]
LTASITKFWDIPVVICEIPELAVEVVWEKILEKKRYPADAKLTVINKIKTTAIIAEIPCIK